jgi:hypothetical protein
LPTATELELAFPFANFARRAMMRIPGSNGS